MAGSDDSIRDLCYSRAARQATRRITALYDQALAPVGLRITQHGLLSALRVHGGAVTINEVAATMLMDRTTVADNLKPLARQGLVLVRPGTRDRRRREVELTPAGAALLDRAYPLWQQAQARFEALHDRGAASELRRLLRDVAVREKV